jgi:hypothetical protein
VHHHISNDKELHMSRLTRLTVVAVFCVALMVPAISGAKPGHRGFGQTFPIASRLCNHTTNGHPPKVLAGSVADVLAACTTLHTSFTNAQNAYVTTVGPLQNQAVAALQALRQTCRTAHQNHTPGVCRAARKSTRATIHGLRQQVNVAGQTYHASVDAARKAFWMTIHALKNAASVPADPTVGAAPATSMPSDTQVATA